MIEQKIRDKLKAKTQADKEFKTKLMKKFARPADEIKDLANEIISFLKESRKLEAKMSKKTLTKSDISSHLTYIKSLKRSLGTINEAFHPLFPVVKYLEILKAQEALLDSYSVDSHTIPTKAKAKLKKIYTGSLLQYHWQRANAGRIISSLDEMLSSPFEGDLDDFENINDMLEDVNSENKFISKSSKKWYFIGAAGATLILAAIFYRLGKRGGLFKKDLHKQSVDIAFEEAIKHETKKINKQYADARVKLMQDVKQLKAKASWKKLTTEQKDQKLTELMLNHTKGVISKRASDTVADAIMPTLENWTPRTAAHVKEWRETADMLDISASAPIFELFKQADEGFDSTKFGLIRRFAKKVFNSVRSLTSQDDWLNLDDIMR